MASDPLELATYFADRGRADAANKVAKRKPKRATAVEWHGYDADLGRHLIKLPGMATAKPIGSTLTSGGLTVGQSVDGAPKGQAIAVDGLPGRKPQPVAEDEPPKTQVKWATAWATSRLFGFTESDLTQAKITATVWLLTSEMNEPLAIWSDTTKAIAEVDGAYVLINSATAGTNNSGQQTAFILNILPNGKMLIEGASSYVRVISSVDGQSQAFKYVQFRSLFNGKEVADLEPYIAEFTGESTPPPTPNQDESVQYSEYFANDFFGKNIPRATSPLGFDQGGAIAPRIYWQNATRRDRNHPDTPIPTAPSDDYWWRSFSSYAETIRGTKGLIAALKFDGQGGYGQGTGFIVAVDNLPANNGFTQGGILFDAQAFLVAEGGTLEVWSLSDRYARNPTGFALGADIPGQKITQQRFNPQTDPAFFQTFQPASPDGEVLPGYPIWMGDLIVYDFTFKVLVR